MGIFNKLEDRFAGNTRKDTRSTLSTGGGNNNGESIKNSRPSTSMGGSNNSSLGGNANTGIETNSMSSISTSNQWPNDGGAAIPPSIPSRPSSRLNSSGEGSHYTSTNNGNNSNLGQPSATGPVEESPKSATAIRIVSIGKDNRSSVPSDETSNASDHESEQSAASSYTTQNTAGITHGGEPKSPTEHSSATQSKKFNAPLDNNSTRFISGTPSASDNAERIVNQHLESLYGQTQNRNKAQNRVASNTRKDQYASVGNTRDQDESEPAGQPYDDDHDATSASHVPKWNNNNKKGSGGLASTLVNQAEKIHNRNLHQERANFEVDDSPARNNSTKPDTTLQKSPMSRGVRGRHDGTDPQPSGRTSQNETVNRAFQHTEQYDDRNESYKGGTSVEPRSTAERLASRRPNERELNDSYGKQRKQGDRPEYGEQRRAVLNTKPKQASPSERQVSYNQQDRPAERPQPYGKVHSEMARLSSYCEDDRADSNLDWKNGSGNYKEESSDNDDDEDGDGEENSRWSRDSDEEDHSERNNHQAYARGQNEAYEYERRGNDGHYLHDRSFTSSRGDQFQRGQRPSAERTYSSKSNASQKARFADSHSQQQPSRAPPTRTGARWDSSGRNEYSGNRAYQEHDRYQPQKQRSNTQLNFTTERKMDMAYSAGYNDAMERIKANMMKQFNDN